MLCRWLCALLGILLITCRGAAAESFPSQPVRIVVPGSAGGVLDIAARKISDKLAKALGQPVIIDNKPGANGFVAFEAVAQAKPDGHTVLLAAISHLCTNPSLFTNMPYDPIKDFAPVTLGAGGEPVLLVNPALPIKSVAELIAYAKARPGRVTFGSPGIGSPQHLVMELFQRTNGITMLHVPYKNNPQIATDLIGGAIDTAVEYVSMMGPHMQSGKLRALAVVGEHRKPAFPAIPTAAEAGVPDFKVFAWYGYVVPAGTPPAVIARLNKDFSVALKSREYVEFVENLGSRVLASTPEEFAQRIRSDHSLWSRVIKEANIKVE